MPILACILFAVRFQAGQADLAEPLRMDAGAILKMFDLGFRDADKRRKPDDLANALRRGIGKIRTAPLKEVTVSFIWMRDPYVQAYLQGWSARHEYRDESEVKKAKDAWTAAAATGRKHLFFNGVINILPSFGGLYGRIDHPSTPGELKGVRVVLKVGDRVYQPQTQPGDLEYQQGTGTNTTSAPGISSTTTNVQASGPGGSASGTITTTSYYTVYHTEKYDYYQGRFQVVFDLFDPDGTPRVRPGDKELTAIVIYGPNERPATYTLNELASIHR